MRLHYSTARRYQLFLKDHFVRVYHEKDGHVSALTFSQLARDVQGLCEQLALVIDRFITDSLILFFRECILLEIAAEEAK